MQKSTFTIDKNTTLICRQDGKPGVRRKLADGELEEIPVRVVRCFPWRHRYRYISIRQDDGKEIHLLPTLDEITDTRLRQLIAQELDTMGFVPIIRRIDGIINELDLFRWNVTTDAGERTFYTRRNEIPRQLSDDGVVIKDISGDRYAIQDIEALDPDSKNWLWLYLD